MTVWVVNMPSNEVLGVYSTAELAQEAADKCERVQQWKGWGWTCEPQEVTLVEGCGMTDEQAKQYEICKARRHEAVPVAQSAMLTPEEQMQAMGQAMLQAAGPFWKVCRWCGMKFRDIEEAHTRQIERVQRG